MKVKEIMSEIIGFFRQEEGIGVIEVVLILVVLIGLVIIFKGQINSQSKEVY